MTSAEEFWNATCPEHGGLLHALMHESGHAAVAVHEGFRFVDVSINPDPRQHPNELGHVTGGGVRLASFDAIKELVIADPVKSLRFFLAGAVTEVGAFEHTIDKSFAGDVNLWRNCAGLLNHQTYDTLEIALGVSFTEVHQQTRDLVTEIYPAIKAVTHALYDDQNWTLTYSEVARIVTSTL